MNLDKRWGGGGDGGGGVLVTVKYLNVLQSHIDLLEVLFLHCEVCESHKRSKVGHVVGGQTNNYYNHIY